MCSYIFDYITKRLIVTKQHKVFDKKMIKHGLFFIVHGIPYKSLYVVSKRSLLFLASFAGNPG